jgi:hypothetical protein
VCTASISDHEEEKEGEREKSRKTARKEVFATQRKMEEVPFNFRKKFSV